MRFFFVNNFTPVKQMLPQYSIINLCSARRSKDRKAAQFLEQRLKLTCAV